MQLPPTPAPSPSPEDGLSRARADTPQHELWWGFYPTAAPASPGRYGDSNPCAPGQTTTAVALRLNDGPPHPSLLSPLLDSPPPDLFFTLPPVAEVVGRLDAESVTTAPRKKMSFYPPPACPEPISVLSDSGYVYDLDTAQLPTSSGHYDGVQVQAFLPNVSLYQGPAHVCGPTQAPENAIPLNAGTTHALEHVRHDVLICNVCLKAFNTESTAIIHAHIHGPPHVHFCGCCKDGFNSAAEREAHWSQNWSCREGHITRVTSTAAGVIEDWHENALGVARRPHA